MFQNIDWRNILIHVSVLLVGIYAGIMLQKYYIAPRQRPVHKPKTKSVKKSEPEPTPEPVEEPVEEPVKEPVKEPKDIQDIN